MLAAMIPQTRSSNLKCASPTAQQAGVVAGRPRAPRSRQPFHGTLGTVSRGPARRIPVPIPHRPPRESPGRRLRCVLGVGGGLPPPEGTGVALGASPTTKKRAGPPRGPGPLCLDCFILLAESEGFEPPNAFASPDFESGAFSRSASSPIPASSPQLRPRFVPCLARAVKAALTSRGTAVQRPAAAHRHSILAEAGGFEPTRRSPTRA